MGDWSVIDLFHTLEKHRWGRGARWGRGWERNMRFDMKGILSTPLYSKNIFKTVSNFLCSSCFKQYSAVMNCLFVTWHISNLSSKSNVLNWFLLLIYVAWQLHTDRKETRVNFLRKKARKAWLKSCHCKGILQF